MQEQAVICPVADCRSTMNYRLGEYECPSCGHRQAGPPPEEEPPRQRIEPTRSAPVEKLQNTSGPLLHREENSYGGGWTPTKVRPAEPERAFNLGGDPPEKFFESDKHGMVVERKKTTDKNAFFSAAAFCIAAAMVLSFAGGIGAAATCIVFGSLLLFILWAVLHSEELWTKWTVIGIIAVGWVIVGGSYFAPDLNFWGKVGEVLPLAASTSLSRGFTLCVTAVLDMWLLVLLTQDIRAENAKD